MNGPVLPLLNTQHQSFKGLHQLEKGDRLDLCLFTGFFADMDSSFCRLPRRTIRWRLASISASRRGASL